MSVHKSLVSKMGMSRSRNVYKRDERIAILKKEGMLKGDLHVVGLPKTKVLKAMKKAGSAKAEKKDDKAAPAAGAKAAAPAAGAKAAAPAGKAAAPAKK